MEGSDSVLNHTPGGTPEALSIVIPVRNRAEIVGRTLQSVQRQSYRPLHVILVDNGSTDETAGVLQHFAEKYNGPDFRVTLLNEGKAGACAARNRGLEAVDTPFVMFFDSDDVMMPEHVERAMDARHQNPDADIIGWDVKHADGDFTTVHPFEPDNILYHNLFHATMATQRYMVRTDLVRSAGAWNVNIPVWNDIELGARLLTLNPKIVKATGDASVIVLPHADSITGSGFSQKPQRYGAALEAIAETLPEEKRHWVDLKAIILAGDVVHEGNPCGHAIYTNAMAKTIGKKRRCLYSLAYRYVCMGGRGIARILYPLIK